MKILPPSLSPERVKANDFYAACSKVIPPATVGAVVHLHATHSVAVSMLPETDPDNVLPPLTPYAIMQLGKVKLLSFFVPGDPAIGDAVRGLAGKRSAVLLANHGPVVAGRDVAAACAVMEEPEASARLSAMARSRYPRLPRRNSLPTEMDKRLVETSAETPATAPLSIKAFPVCMLWQLS